MSKRFDFREDNYIVAYWECGLPVADDLGRSEASIKARAKKLKSCGAWDAILRIEKSQKDYLAALGYDEFHQDMATIAR